MPVGRLYTLWGATLGSGVVTTIPHSAFLMVLGAQLTAGPLWGALSGAAYGLAREGPPLVQILSPGDPAQTPRLLATLRTVVRRLNTGIALGGGLLLVLAAWR